MNLLSLINLDNPYCIYCKDMCNIEIKDYSTGRINSASVRHSFDCYTCKENFQIDLFQNKETSYSFSCKEFYISYSKNKNKTFIYFNYSVSPIITFNKEISLEHPNELYTKFKIYVILG